MILPTTIRALCSANNDDGADNYDANVDDNILWQWWWYWWQIHDDTEDASDGPDNVTMMTMAVDDSENNDLIKYFDDICPNNWNPTELLH